MSFETMQRRWWVGGCVVLMSIMLWAQGFSAEAQSPPQGSSGVTAESRMVAPDFELKNLSDSPVKLSQYKGERPVLLYFWATWCPYCMAAKPDLKELRGRVPQKDMEILAINVGGGDSLEKLKKYEAGNNDPWPVLYDGSGKVIRAYQVQGIPLFVLIDKQGNITYRGNSLPKDPMQYLN